MRVRALQPFTVEQGAHRTGDVFEMEDETLAEIRIRAGLLERIGDAPKVEEAVAREPETAVNRPKKAKR